MREHGILFKDFLVRKILAGQKTQTRRLGHFRGADQVRWYKGETHWWKGKPPEPFEGWVAEVKGLGVLLPITCPYGTPGDRLWVRETWAQFQTAGETGIAYRASCVDDEFDWAGGHGNFQRTKIHQWRPSIFMPRWASRITLELTEVRVQRCQDISNADIIAEGFECPAHPSGCPTMRCAELRIGFAEGWDRINAARGGAWDANPWVWALTFPRFEKAASR